MWKVLDIEVSTFSLILCKGDIYEYVSLDMYKWHILDHDFYCEKIICRGMFHTKKTAGLFSGEILLLSLEPVYQTPFLETSLKTWCH